MTDFASNAKRSLQLFGKATIGVIIGLILIGSFGNWISIGKRGAKSDSAQTVLTPAQRAANMANQHLGWAEREALIRLEAHFAPVDELFRSVQTKSFADSCLSWDSKWLLLKDKLN